jgi:prolyl oligopeptidase
LSAFSVSNDGKYLGYGISRAGSDWSELYVKNIETGELLPDQILWVKFSGIAWYKDGFFYSRYPKPDESNVKKGVNAHSKIYYHKIGTKQDADQLIYADDKNPQWSFYADVTDETENSGN